MDRTQKIVVVLLILAIVFSASSIFVSFNALKIDIPGQMAKAQASPSGNGAGNLNLVVNRNDGVLENE